MPVHFSSRLLFILFAVVALIGAASVAWWVERAILDTQLRDVMAVQAQQATSWHEGDSTAVYPGQHLRLYTAQGVLVSTTGGTLAAEDFYAEVAALGAQPYRQAMAGDMVRSFIALPVGSAGAYAEILTPVSAGMAQRTGLQAGALVLVLLAISMGLAQLGAIRRGMVLAELHEENARLQDMVAHSTAEADEKSQFLANVSHELRTPLNAIIGFSEMIRAEVPPGGMKPKHEEYLRDIHQSGIHLMELINDVLDFSKVEAGKLELDIEEVNITKLAASCLRLVAPRAEESQVVVHNAMPKDVLIVETDQQKLKQVLLNLLSNSVKFTPGGGRVEITGWRDLADDAITLQVSDNGVGIAPKDVARALSPFGQVKNDLSERYKGTGLGLPLSRRFVEVLGGTFGIQSELGSGTTITLTLPCHFTAKSNVTVRRTGEGKV